MKLRNFILGLILSAISIPALAQNPQQQNSSGTLTAADTTCLQQTNDSGCVVLPLLAGAGGATFSIQNIGSQTITFEETTDGTNYSLLTVTNIATGAQVTSTAANGVFQVNLSGMAVIHARDSAYTSGSATVVIKASTTSARGGVGSGGGTAPASSSIGPVINIQNATYGAKGTARCVTDAVMTNGSPIVTSATAAYTSMMAGWEAYVFLPNGTNNGPCNDSLNANVTAATLKCGSATAGVVTTILSVDSPTQVHLSTNCPGTSIGGNTMIFGPNDFAAVSAACAALPVTGGSVYAPIGQYLVDNSAGTSPTCYFQTTVTGSGEFFGQGQDMTKFFIPPWYNHTFNFGSVIANYAGSGGSNTHGFLHDFTLDFGTLCTSQGPDTAIEAYNPAIDRVTVSGICLNSGSTEGMYFASGNGTQNNWVRDVTVTSLYNVGIMVSGPYVIKIDNPYILVSGIALGATSSAGNSNITINGGNFQCKGTSQQANCWDFPLSGSPAGMKITAYGPTICGQTGSAANAILINNATATLRLFGAKINDTGGACGGSIGTNQTGIAVTTGLAYVSGSVITASGSGVPLANTGTLVVDLGGNAWSGGAAMSGTGPTLLNATSTGLSTPVITGTGACVTVGSQLGTGPFSGSVACTGSSGAATLVFTWAANASNKFKCPLPIDVTTGADVFTFGTQNATSCSFSAAAIVANDVISFGPNSQY